MKRYDVYYILDVNNLQVEGDTWVEEQLSILTVNVIDEIEVN